MENVFRTGTLGCLYGSVFIGSINSVLIMMGDHTRSDMYRVKYGFAMGIILGLLYGTIRGIQGEPLIPTFSGSENSPPLEKAHLWHPEQGRNDLRKANVNPFTIHANLVYIRF